MCISFDTLCNMRIFEKEAYGTLNFGGISTCKQEQ